MAELRQMHNNIEAVGTLKSKFLELKKSKAGDNYIKGNIVLEVKDEDEINELRFDAFAMEFTSKGEENKQYKALTTIATEYKTLDDDGEDADRVKVLGRIGFNEYTNKDNEYVGIQTYDGNFFSRVTEPEDFTLLDVEMVINKIEPGEDTTKVSGLHVGYANKVIPINDVVVPNNIFEKMKPYYKVGETVGIQCTLHNAVIIAEEESVGEMVFGDYEPQVVKQFIRQIRFKGGKMPYKDGDKEKVSVEDFEFIKTTREQDYIAVAPVESSTDNVPFGDDMPFSADDFSF